MKTIFEKLSMRPFLLVVALLLSFTPHLLKAKQATPQCAPFSQLTPLFFSVLFCLRVYVRKARTACAVYAKDITVGHAEARPGRKSRKERGKQNRKGFHDRNKGSFAIETPSSFHSLLQFATNSNHNIKETFLYCTPSQADHGSLCHFFEDLMAKVWVAIYAISDEESHKVPTPQPTEQGLSGFLLRPPTISQKFFLPGWGVFAPSFVVAALQLASGRGEG